MIQGKNFYGQSSSYIKPYPFFMSLAIARLLYIEIGQVVHSRLIKMSSGLAQARDVTRWSVFWLAGFLDSIDTNALMPFKIKRVSIQKGGNIKLVG